MSKNMNKTKIFMIIGICLLVTSIIGSSVAYYSTVVLDDLGINTVTQGLDFFINYTKGTDITSATLNSSSSYEGSTTSTEIELWKDADTPYDIYSHIYLDINQISTNISNYSVLKYTVLNNNKVINEGTIKGSSGDSVLIKANIPLQTTTQLYKIYIWLDERIYPENSISGENVSLTVRCEGTMETIPMNVTEFITDLYNNAEQTTITHAGDGVTYSIAESVSLMNDRHGTMDIDIEGGNLRYYGGETTTYNYVDIGDRDSEGNIILYRMIGLFKNIEVVKENGTTELQDLVKVIRADSIGDYSWDNKTSGIGTSTTYYGSNDWTDSRLMMLLNPEYQNDVFDTKNNLLNEHNRSYYWYSKGTVSEPVQCYSGSSNKTKDCYFESTGLSVEARSKIETVVWDLGGLSSSSIYGGEAYASERGGSDYVPTGHATEWLGKVALAYPSDIYFARKFSNCSGNLYSSCSNSYTWLYYRDSTTSDSGYWWTLAPYSSGANSAWRAYGGTVYNSRYAYKTDGVRPVFYLKSNVIKTSGTGQKTDPYVLG